MFLRTSFAADAGVRDTVRFAKCAAASDALPRVDNGLAIGRELGVGGTPTIMLNDWQFGRPPTDSELVHSIDSLVTRRRTQNRN